MDNWKILIICSSKEDIHLEYYANDPLFKLKSKNFAFFNLGKERFAIDSFEVVNAIDIPEYNSLGRKYAEAEVIYNVKKLKLFSEYEYIGFMHYDFVFFDKFSLNTNITEIIDDSVKRETKFLSFFTGKLEHIIGYYNVLFDSRKPNCLFVRDSGLDNPVSINSKIVNDISRLLGKQVDLNKSTFDLSILNVALCCSFFTKREFFEEIGTLIVDVFDSHCLDGFDVEDKHRFPGQVAERYVAMYSLLIDNKICMQLMHRFEGGQKDLANASNAENY